MPQSFPEVILDDEGFHCQGSHSKLVLEESVRLKFFGSNAVVSCDEVEAQNLLLYVDHCLGVRASINMALRSAGLSVDDYVLTPTRAESELPFQHTSWVRWSLLRERDPAAPRYGHQEGRRQERR
jgi:hypothetical protein